MSRVLILSCMVLAACTQPAEDPNTIRIIKLRLNPPNSSQEALGGTRPVQLAAAEVKDGALVKISAGESIDARTIQTLSVGVPKNTSVNLFLQTPRGGSAGAGILVGRLEWPDGAGNTNGRLPVSDRDIDLGEVSFVTGDPGTLADNRLPVAQENNPLQRTDRDQDGQDDLLDTDDDGDGTPDAQDDDADGDGSPDALQELSSLPDDNGDGVPNALE